ncbi:MAG: hypothetical protein ACOX8V_04430 [Thermoleophilia bacterium]|jgi:hypothetical protein
MNVGQQTIEWLYTELLRVDDKWSEPTPAGFRWWPDKNIQTIEIIGQSQDSDGDAGHLISIRTELLRSLVLDEGSLTRLNTSLMPLASLSGPVYSPETQTLSLCSLVALHEGILSSMRPLIGMAAVLQASEARTAAARLTQVLEAEEAISGHPTNGIRPEPDELTDIVEGLITPLGKEPSRWQPGEFQQLVDRYTQESLALCATVSGPSITVEFPYTDEPSLLRATANEPHPDYGNGLSLMQSFSIDPLPEAEGAALALSLNDAYLRQKPSGYGLGSYSYKDGAIRFTSFFPNAIYSRGLLTNIFYSSAGRAREMALRLPSKD